jgi:hypothetical protein
MVRNTNGIWKYCYWLDDSALGKIKKEMEKEGTTLVRAEKNPCEALRGPIGYAEPQTWNIICKHDAAPWYHASNHAGKNLVVASFPLDETYDPLLETTIEQSTFEPIDFPPEEELSQLAQDPTYRSRKREGWGGFPKEMGDAIVKGLGKMSGKPLDTFEDLLCIWDAVHSNFIIPQYRSGKEFMKAPYSIADSIHIGTCCVELFNLLDSQEDALLVRPCIGSVIVKVLEKDRYYLVRLVNSGKNREERR